MEYLKRLLVNLDSVKASVLFVGALAVAGLSIVFNIGVPAIPIAVVLLYGCVLLAASLWCFVPHSEMTKNSPYFLAFLLFLVALYSIFNKGQGNFSSETLMPRLGAALLPTVIGLCFRQILFALDPAQRDHDVFYRTLEEELKRNAVEFKKAQIHLVELVEDFTTTRRSMLAAEEKAAQDYIGQLRKAIAIFEDTGALYPKAIQDAITTLNRRLNGVVQKLDQVIEKVGEVDAGSISGASDALRNLTTEVSAANAQLVALRTGAEMTTRELSGVASGVQELVVATGAGIERSSDVLLGGLRDTITKLRNAIDTEHQNIATVAQPIREDLLAIDRILNDFVKLLEAKILTASAGGKAL